MVDAMRGLGGEIFAYINEKKFFVIHAARQSGKTTLLRALARQIGAEGKYRVVYCSLENLEGVSDVAAGIPAVVKTLKMALIRYGLPEAAGFADGVDFGDPYNAFQAALETYCRSLDKPLVLLFDETDCLSGATLIAFLRQLRNGYVNRDEIPFVHSLALVGMRNIKDYRDEYRLPAHTLGSSSPFNIVAGTMTLQNFSEEEINGLYAQHTAETGIAFHNCAVNLVWEQTQGQPWLVSAIAKDVVARIDNGAPVKTVNADMVSDILQTLILRRDAHFDSIMARLREDRVRRVIEPVIIGKEAAIDSYSDDYSYVKDLGLIRDDRGRVEPANPIYGEVIVRTLSRNTQDEIGLGGAYPAPGYMVGGVLDMDAVLGDFQVFWRENESIWRKKYDYQEAAPQLILQAFLQRIVNGGGRIEREMAAGTGRTDICAIYKDRKYPIELKIRRDEGTYAKCVSQAAGYMERLGCVDGWLVLFDQSKDTPWKDRLFVKKETIGDKAVTVFGC